MKTKTEIKTEQRNRRHARVRAKVSGTKECPRLSVYKSNMAVYAQLIDDARGITIVSSTSRVVSKGTRLSGAHEVGKDIAMKGVAKGIKSATFDRGGFVYTGIVKAVADGAREGGLTL
jgi:large subunit ribosomal protein L18